MTGRFLSSSSPLSRKPNRPSNSSVEVGIQLKRALVTGITGQDGSYLAELLLSKGYEVHGLIRRASTFNTSRIDHLYVDPHQADARLFLHYGDLTDGTRLVTLLSTIDPDEVYNLAAQSHVRVNFDEPVHTGDTTGWERCDCRSRSPFQGGLPLLSGVLVGDVRRVAAPAESADAVLSTFPVWRSEGVLVLGDAQPREAYGLFAVNGILFNHESPRRGETFVTRKITQAVARIEAGLKSELYHGQPRCRPRLGLCAEYVEGMWRMMQAPEPDDFVLATGRGYTCASSPRGIDHAGLDWQKHVKFDERYLRPTEVDSLIGDASKAAQSLGGKPPCTPPNSRGSW